MRVVMSVAVMFVVKEMMLAASRKTRRSAKNESEQDERNSFHVEQRTTLRPGAASRSGTCPIEQGRACRAAKSRAGVH